MQREYDYCLKFEDITLGISYVQVTSYRIKETYIYQVFLDDRDIGIRALPQMPEAVSDMVDLAIAVFATDRILNADLKQRFHIHVILPVRSPDKMNSSFIKGKLLLALEQYTENKWDFTFTNRLSEERPSALQHSLPFIDTIVIETALWSGGLDALAGFYNRFSHAPDKHFVLFGTGSNTAIHRLQENLRSSVENQYPSTTTLIRLPYSVRKVNKTLPRKPLLRSRGFTFVLLGAICAYLQGQHELYVYENGIGAINLPFRMSEIGLDHSRAVHPLSLRYMAELFSSVVEEEFQIVNPFLFSTKAQMCEVFSYSDQADLIAETITCDHMHRNISDCPSMQCGRCSSCTLRRHALLAAGINDKTRYVYEEFFPNSTQLIGENDHLPATLYQVNDLRTQVNSANPWKALRHQYPTLSLDIVDRASQSIGIGQNELIERIVGLYREYVFEWDGLR